MIGVLARGFVFYCMPLCCIGLMFMAWKIEIEMRFWQRKQPRQSHSRSKLVKMMKRARNGEQCGYEWKALDDEGSWEILVKRD